MSGKPVVIEYRVGTGAWKTAGTATTGAGGAFSYTAKPTVKTTYQARFVGDGTYAATASASRTVTPRVYLPRTSNWTKLAYKKTYYATGYIAPKHASSAGKVRIRAYKRASNGRYYYKTAYTAKYSYYSATKTRLQGRGEAAVEGHLEARGLPRRGRLQRRHFGQPRLCDGQVVRGS